MKLVKSLLLGSAAGIVAVGSAVAADLPVRKAAPVDYVQVCSQFGTGYFYIPGTDTCLRIGGLVRYQADYRESNWSAGTTVGAGTNAPIVTPAIGRGNQVFAQNRSAIMYDLDVMAATATEFGTLMSTAKLRNGNLDRAFINFAGFTIGLAPNQFFFKDSPAYNGGLGKGSTRRNQISYTADLGMASVTFGIQDPTNTNAVLVNTFRTDNANVAAFNSNATEMPDMVGNVKASFGDVSVHLGGALTQLRTTNRSNAPTVTGNPFASTSYGFALVGGVEASLAAISPGTSFWLEGTYVEGALNYLGAYNGGNTRFNVTHRDAYQVNGSVSKTTGWSIRANLAHAWTPTVSQNIYGTYGEVSAPSSARRQFVAGTTPFNLQSDPMQSTYFQIGSNVAWTPVAGLLVGLDVNYTQVEAQHRVLTSGQANTPNATYARKADEWRSTLRIQRSF
ncbi:MAG: porin [Salinarimonas sp.]